LYEEHIDSIWTDTKKKIEGYFKPIVKLINNLEDEYLKHAKSKVDMLRNNFNQNNEKIDLSSLNQKVKIFKMSKKEIEKLVGKQDIIDLMDNVKGDSNYS